MPVNTLHPEYESAMAGWDRARDVLAGEDRLKARGKVYLPRMDSQTDDEFNAYVARASFFNATARTLEGYLGLLFRREPSVNLPAAIQALAADIDLRGSGLVGYAKRVCSEVIALGRCGTLVEWNDDGGEHRPFVAFYEAENITNWRVARVDVYATAWTGATTGQKEVALVMATRLIDAHFRFLGSRTSETQALAWPRVACPNPDLRRYLLPSSAVPTALVQATAETARALIIEDRTANPLGEGLKFTGLGDLQQSFDKADRRPVIPRVAQALLHGLGYYLERGAAVPLERC